MAQSERLIGRQRLGHRQRRWFRQLGGGVLFEGCHGSVDGAYAEMGNGHRGSNATLEELRRVVEDLHRRGICPDLSGDEVMKLTRGED